MSVTTETDPAAAPATDPAPLWRAMPGWGIAADLTPPEVVKARQVAVLRRSVAVGLAGVLLVCGAGYYAAARERAAADAELALVTDRTTQLQAVGRSYSDVVAIQNWVTRIQSRIATTMQADVDLVALIGQLQSSLPETMTISQESITISPAGVAGAVSALDQSGSARIGTITMNGTGQTLDDLSDYIDRLQAVPGLVDVMPLANAVSGDGASGTQFSLTMGLTDALLSNRYELGG